MRRFVLRAVSSGVEQRTFNPLVGGSNPPPPTNYQLLASATPFFGVLQFRRRLQTLLSGARQDEFASIETQLARLNSDVVSAEADESAGADDHVRQAGVG